MSMTRKLSVNKESFTKDSSMILTEQARAVPMRKDSLSRLHLADNEIPLLQDYSTVPSNIISK